MDYLENNDINKILDGIVDKVFLPNFFLSYLDFVSYFTNVDYQNQLLLYGQIGSVCQTKMIAGKKAWEENGRKVKEDAKPAIIIFPQIERVKMGEYKKDDTDNILMSEEGNYPIYEILPEYQIHDTVKPVYKYEDTIGENISFEDPIFDIKKIVEKMKVKIEEVTKEDIELYGNERGYGFTELNGYLTEDKSGNRILKIKEGLGDVKKKNAIIEVFVASEIIQDDYNFIEEAVKLEWNNFIQLVSVLAVNVLKMRYKYHSELTQNIIRFMLESVDTKEKRHLLLHAVQHTVFNVVNLFEQEVFGFLEILFANQITNDTNLTEYTEEIAWIGDHAKLVYRDKLWELRDIVIRMDEDAKVKEAFLKQSREKKMYTFPPYVIQVPCGIETQKKY